MAGVLVSASTGVMSSVIGKLATLMGEEYKKHKSMQREVTFLKDELASMNAVLEKLANMEEELDPQTMEWRNQVMDMAFDIEDCVDYFMHHVADANADLGFVRQTARRLKTLRVRRQIANKMKELIARVKDVSERRQRYSVDECASSSSYVQVDPRVPALYMEAANLVGMEGPKKEVTKLLTEEDGASVQGMRVVSIVGFGGLGKTTLANEVYREVGGQYDCKMFVSVSQRPDLMKLLNRIISKAGMPQPTHTYEVQDLIDNIREYLHDKRYFFVIDDIWDESVWEILRCAFPENKNGSKVITTTRIETVAKSCCRYRHGLIHKMKQLDYENSRKLFFSRVGQVCPHSFKEISDEILQKCGGLPLAIISIASLLATQPGRSMEQWKYVCSSLRSNLRTNPTWEGMRQVLKLGYNNLPHHLKTCLLYIGIYPEDYEIRKKDLVRQWVAEGFVSKIHDRDAEEVAGSYFNELVNRSMIQPTEIDYNGEVSKCNVHDMILDLIRLKSEEENFLRVVYNLQGLTTALHSKVRRLSLHFDYAANPDIATAAAAASLKLSHIRSLVLFGQSCFKLPISEFKSIRVLNFECWGGDKAGRIDLTPISKLFQLRYLRISGDAQLPTQIGGLQHLETLELDVGMAVLPSDIVHLPCLLHLRVPERTRLPDGICQMKSLRTLEYFHVGENSVDNIKGLGELTNLRDLWISFEHNDDSMSQQGIIDAFWSSIGKLINCNLRALQIGLGIWYSPPAVELGSLTTSHTESSLERLHAATWMFPKVPSWTGQHHKLSSLRLTVKKLMQDGVDLLAGLPNLAHLFVWTRKSPEERIVIRGGMVAFPVLKDFTLWFAQCLTFEAGAMANLQSLRRCLHARGVERYGPPTLDGVEHLLSLRQVSLCVYFDAGDTESHKTADNAVAILRNVINVHPGHPSVKIALRDNRKWPPLIRELSSDNADGDEGVEEATR